MDKVFFERIKVLIKIAVPSYKTKEALYLVVLTGLLVIRTYMSIWLADVNGQVVKAIVNRNFAEFVRRVREQCSKECVSVDIRPDDVCDPFLRSQLCDGVLQQAPRHGLPQTPHLILP